MSGAQGFLKGFFNATASSIKEKKDQADDYFNQQMELAHKVGMQNHAKRQELMRGGVMTAERLLSVGVPKNIVMSVANQNPDDLENLYKEVTTMQRQGVQFTPEVWDSIVEVKGEVDPNMSMQEFFSQVYGPLQANMRADPESFRLDPKGSVWATMMGANAMDRARSRLDTTEVVDGLSASDVLRTDLSPRRVTDASASFNFNVAGELSREARDNDSGYLDIRDLEFVDRKFSEILEEERMKFMRINERAPTDEEMEELKYVVGDRMLSWGIDPEAASKLGPGFRKYFFPDEISENEEEEGIDTEPSPEEATREVLEAASGASPTVGAIPEAPATPTPPSDPVTTLLEDMPIDPEKEPALATLPQGEVFVKDNGDGTSTYLLTDGTEVLIENRIARQAARASGLPPLNTPLSEGISDFMDPLPLVQAPRLEDSPTLVDRGLLPDWSTIREGNREQRARRNAARRERNRERKRDR